MGGEISIVILDHIIRKVQDILITAIRERIHMSFRECVQICEDHIVLDEIRKQCVKVLVQ